MSRTGTRCKSGAKGVAEVRVERVNWEIRKSQEDSGMQRRDGVIDPVEGCPSSEQKEERREERTQNA